MNVQVRDSKAEDIPLVFDSYLKSWRLSKWAGVISNNNYFEVQRTMLEDLLARGALLKVAHPEGHADIILGWGLGEVKDGKQVVHYLFIKDSYVGLAVADRILDALPGSTPGFLTHKLYFPRLKDYTHAPEIARRKSL